jgi:sortase A
MITDIAAGMMPGGTDAPSSRAARSRTVALRERAGQPTASRSPCPIAPDSSFRRAWWHPRSRPSPDTPASTSAVAAARYSGSRRRFRIVLSSVLAIAGLACALDAGWIHAKAALAQVLLERSWSRTVADGAGHRPWPWADTRAVARLRVPRLDRSQIVLAGDNGRTLAFGPGWAEASAAPNAGGTSVISGHRDTHFAWLGDLAAGDIVGLESHAAAIDYVVTSTRIVDSDLERIDPDAHPDGTLLLVTCWPFDAVVAGGPLRYVVTARAVVDRQQRQHPLRRL